MNNIQYLIRNRYRKNSRKAVSPVISTIIIVAIAIAISIAVALYLTGITGQFTRFERLDVTSAYANPVNNLGVSNVELNVKNSGTSVLTIDRVLINGRPAIFEAVPDGNATTWKGASKDIVGDPAITLAQGEGGNLILPIKGTSGLSIELTLHTVSGKEYPKVVLLP